MMTKNERTSWSDVAAFSIDKFDIDVPPPSERLYANGRQQVAIGVEIRFISGDTPDENNNHGPMPLSDTELASVRLVQYRGGAELPATWNISRDKNDYLPHPDVVRRAHPRGDTRAAPPGTEYVDFYVTTTAMPGSLRMALAITRDDGKVFISNDLNDQDFPKEVEITLHAEIVPSYEIRNFGFAKTTQEENVDLFVHVYSLSLLNNQNNQVAFHSVQVQPAGMIQWHDKVADETHASYAGHAQPGESKVTWNTAINYGTHTPVATVALPVKGEAAFVLVGRNEIRYHSDSAINHNGPLGVSALDAYGNEHTLRVSFKSPAGAGRLELVLAK